MGRVGRLGEGRQVLVDEVGMQLGVDKRRVSQDILQKRDIRCNAVDFKLARIDPHAAAGWRLKSGNASAGWEHRAVGRHALHVDAHLDGNPLRGGGPLLIESEIG